MNLNDIKLTFDHSVQEMELILAGLKKLPMELVENLHNKLKADANAQFTAQAQAMVTPAAPTETPETPTEAANDQP
jgi:hypothetical protein